VLSVRGLCVDIVRAGGRERVVHGLDFELSSGKTLSIIGESGAGKSMSVLAIMGLLPPEASVSGSIRYRKSELVGLSEIQMRGYRGRRIGMVFQDSESSLNPTIRIGRQIAESVSLNLSVSRKVADRRVVELLHLLKFDRPNEQFFAFPHELSGGMRQRAAIAIAIGAEPGVLITDEGTRSLDMVSRVAFMDLLQNLTDRFQMAHLIVSHDLALASRYSDDVLVLYRGSPIEYSPADSLFACPRVPYTAALVSAMPRVDRMRRRHLSSVVEKRIGVPGEAMGCAFASGCARADPRCWTQKPGWTASVDGYGAACWNAGSDSVSK
jgi:oligopeptide/dipeptide ABC transporter ATP-binding protein